MPITLEDGLSVIPVVRAEEQDDEDKETTRKVETEKRQDLDRQRRKQDHVRHPEKRSSRRAPPHRKSSRKSRGK